MLLIFAGLYRLGGGPETLLVVQAAFAALAAVPLFYATRRLTGMPVVAMGVAIAYLMSPALHRALDFDFHPELMSPVFLFIGLYFLSAKRPLAAILAVAPVLLLKEDMAVVALMFGMLVWIRGERLHGAALAGFSILWGLSTVFVIMPLVRGGGSDLNERFAYLFADTSFATVIPVAVSRGASHLATETLPSLLNLLASAGWVAILSPAILLAAPFGSAERPVRPSSAVPPRPSVRRRVIRTAVRRNSSCDRRHRAWPRADPAGMLRGTALRWRRMLRRR